MRKIKRVSSHRTASKKTNIESLPVGKELDEHIAQNILRWQHKDNYWIEKKGQMTIPHTLPKFSTCLSDAWKLVEFIEDQINQLTDESELDFFKLESFGGGNYIASFGEYYWARSSTTPHAICLACIEAHLAMEA